MGYVKSDKKIYSLLKRLVARPRRKCNIVDRTQYMKEEVWIYVN